MRTIFTRLAFGALLMTAGAGCGPIGVPSPTGGYTKASGVNVVNCKAQGDLGAAAWAVYYKVGYSNWIQAGQANVQAAGNACDGVNLDNIDPGSSVFIGFDSNSDYHIRAIEMDFGDPANGVPPTCDSSTGDAVGCSYTQVRDRTYTGDANAMVETFPLK